MNKTTDKTNFRYQIGIDISKQYLDCWLRPQGRHLRCGNDQSGFDQLNRWLLEGGCRPATSVVCFENTGLYGRRLWVWLSERGWRCAVEKTTVLQKVGPEHHRKDDAFDACLLAEYADRFSDQLHIQTPDEQSIDLLGQFHAERRRLVNNRTAVLNKQQQAGQQAYRSNSLDQMWQQQLALLNTQIERLEQKMDRIIDTHEDLKAYYSLLVSIPGIGDVTAKLWLILFYGQARLHPKKIASRFGFAPHSQSSGSSVNGRTRSTGHGNAEIRACMTMAARSASTHCKRFKDYKHRKLDEGKCWPLVRNNIINKLIKIICAIWNSGQLYDPNHISRFNRQKKAVGT